MLIAKHQSDPGQKTYMLNYPYLLYPQVFSYVVDKVLGGKLWPREWLDVLLVKQKNTFVYH